MKKVGVSACPLSVFQLYDYDMCFLCSLHQVISPCDFRPFCCFLFYKLEMCGNRFFVTNPSHFNDFIPIPISI